MLIGKTDKFWVVTDAKATSELVDVLFETTLEGLERQFKGGLTCDENPAIFSDAKEAEAEALARLAIAKAAEAMRRIPDKRPLKNAFLVQVKDKKGATLFETEL
ncbi:MAG: hypothetical protein LHV69_09780 [Elusimicrobia bacterium]|nr:hypothetical protein [Candidatus Obscuribacterium magneticum]